MVKKGEIMLDDCTLTEALAARGITHKRDDKTTNDYRHSWSDADGNFLGRFDAHEGWNLIRRSEP